MLRRSTEDEMSFGNPSDDEIREILTAADDASPSSVARQIRPATVTRSLARSRPWGIG